MTYILRFPFKPIESQVMQEGSFPFQFEYDSKVWMLELSNAFSIVKIFGFQTEDEAVQYIPKVEVALCWVMLDIHCPTEYEIECMDVMGKDGSNLEINGVPFHGLAEGNMPVVYQEGERISYIYGGTAQFSQQLYGDHLGASILKGLNLTKQADVSISSKLRTAFDLYRAYFYEKSYNAKLLTLVMALEALLPRQTKHNSVKILIDRWEIEIQAEIERITDDNEALSALQSLKRDINFKRYKSLRSEVKALVLKVARQVDPENAEDLAKASVKIYDTRSSLVHSGTLEEVELRSAVSEAQSIVSMVLRSKLCELSQSQ